MKVLRVVGARPQFMQVPVVRDVLLQRGHEHVLLHTGQHYDDSMSAVFFRELGIPPADINLGISELGHGGMTGRMMEGIERSLQEVRPDVLLVDGDTNSTMAAALSAVKLHIPVVHIEAGLRDFDRKRPEEINRVVTDHVASINCAPIPRAISNLENEGLGASAVLTGDVLLDCFVHYFERRSHSVVAELELQPGGYYLSTLHRPENTDLVNAERFSAIFGFLSDLDKPVILPLHPRSRRMVEQWQSAGGRLGAIRLVPPVTYLEMLALLEGADCVFTDSGGLPREAVWMGCRCVMLFREDTWHDLLEQGWAAIGKTDRSSIEAAFNQAVRPDKKSTRDFFGGGEAAKRVVEQLESMKE
ncbi:non-hydrolyzing UDP-N-acetylglucosamine 2-epimerase [Acidovorax sp. NCPPB 3576]|uniref:non-hydrolyzing UDP-N-acetylglucosamine 2-epimerase n=1 Tax=Acidovorax sp. NCPPB 3576 TaxID=2940488 RepID=UPI00234B19BB|nr:UDP-N-acetylglucosamine 2-epimerase (non-hydrolyzing) [Acidovorax sp. NCPPB 3576]WCM89328.1 UDP-N-acetylglucosamine 2-epimerase (non-hydrolyzing) [Acidovorax sp. NCPPB 3576]